MAQPQTDRTARGTGLALGSMALLTASVIVHDRETERVVLLRRGPEDRFAPGRWDLPGGKNEPGEPVTMSAVRELREETGLIVRPESLRVAHLVHGVHGVEAPNGYLTVVFVADEWSGEPANREPAKHTEARWVGIGRLPGDLVPSTSSALRRYLADGPDVSLIGW